MAHTYQVIIIGAGASGAGLARDLALRGVDCLLLERGDVNAGASGRNHGLLHSGARYAVVDPRAAAECAREGAIIKRILPQCVDDCGGLFVAVPGDDPDYISAFPEYCAAAGVGCRAVDPVAARALEPALARDITAVYAVPDASVDPFMLSLENVAAFCVGMKQRALNATADICAPCASAIPKRAKRRFTRGSSSSSRPEAGAVGWPPWRGVAPTFCCPRAPCLSRRAD